MNKTLFALIVALTTVIIATSAPVFAEEGHKGQCHKGMGHRGGGCSMPSFADFDLDGDGVISEEEFSKARGERIAKRAAEGRRMKNLADAPSFADIDADGDGGVSPEEFSAHQSKCKMKHRK